MVPQNDIPTGIASRPYDTMLKDNQYNIETYDFTDFDASIHDCFERFKIPPITDDVAFLIDLDGTIIDSSMAHYNSYKKVIESRNKKFFSVDMWETMISNGNVNDYLSDYFSKEEMEQIKEEKIQEFSKQSIRFTNNCEDFLQWLIRKNINMCIITNTNYKTVEIIKSKLPLLQKITNWIAREDYLHPKPSSECFEMAIKKYGFENKKIIGMEDTNVGYKSLKRVTDIICLYSGKSTETFANNDCYIFNDYKRLQKFFT
jgi:HAD superfamily hydrolase (TIGR01509 family)